MFIYKICGGDQYFTEFFFIRTSFRGKHVFSDLKPRNIFITERKKPSRFRHLWSNRENYAVPQNYENTSP